jgi:diketogulonate reductase-like aldo/keto reductase
MSAAHHPTRRTILRTSLAAAVSSVCLRGGAFADATAGEKQTMLTRPVPASGEQIPVIGMGTWSTFDPPSLDEGQLEPLREVLRIFHAAGGRVIDSSPMYGKSEDVAGRLTTELGINDDLFFATKAWTDGEQAGIDQMRNSLKRLRRDRIELMQVHNFRDLQTHLKTMRKWKDEGTFRYIGVTHYQVQAFDELERILRREKLDFVQFNYSIAEPQAEDRMLPVARELGVATLINRTFLGGDLFKKLAGKPLPEEVKPYAKSWAQAMLKFCLAHEAVTCVIPATRNPKHMADNVQAGFGELPDKAALAALREIGKQL